MKKTILTTAIVLSLLFLGAVSQAEDPRWCLLCGMNLKMYHQTSNRLTFNDGSKVQTCSIFCAAQYYEKRPTEIDRWEVVDYGTKAFIDAKKASWVIGSAIPGVMTAVGKLAFASKEEAEKFQKAHGGTVGTFEDALNRTLADLGSDRKMIMARVAERARLGRGLAEKHDCFRCHGEEGRAGTASAFTTKDFAGKMTSRTKIKEAILKGVPGMTGYEGKLDEKDLHSITLYLWSLKPAQ